MKLTPLDIRKQDFARTLRGYDADEVQAFLRTMADQWEDLLDERRRHEATVRDLKAKMEHYERVEEALQEALTQARRTSEKTISNAEREAEVLLKEARAEADDITRTAKTRRDRLKEEATHLGDRRGEVAAQLRAFLMAEMEMLARFEGKDPGGFIKLLPVEERRRLREAAAALPSAPNQEPTVEGKEETLRDEQRANAPAHSSSVQEAADEKAEASPPEDARPALLRRVETGERAESEQTEKGERAEGGRAAGERAAGEYEAPEEDGDGSKGAEEASPEAPREEAPREEAPREEAPREERPGWSVRSLLSARLDEELDSDALDAEEPPPAEEPEAAPAPGADRPSRRSKTDDVTATSEEIEKIRRILNDMD